MIIFNRIFKPRAQREQESREAAIADPIIDRLVAATDRRLSYVKDYRESLRGPVISARGRLAEMIARIPGPVEVSSASWPQDDTVKALFVKPADAVAAFSENAGVRAFFDKHPAADCLGMLGLEQHERSVLATVPYGESMQAEVRRTTVSFMAPQILAPEVDEVAVRSELVIRAMEYLALRALERVGSLRVQKRELEADRALLQAQLRLAQRRGTGFGGMGAEGETGLDRAALERDLANTVAQLEEAASRNLLPALVEELLEALAQPDKHLTIEPCPFALDSMNFAVAPSPQAVTPRVAILKLARRGPFAVLIARFPRAELRAPQNRLAEAAKFL